MCVLLCVGVTEVWIQRQSYTDSLVRQEHEQHICGLRPKSPKSDGGHMPQAGRGETPVWTHGDGEVTDIVDHTCPSCEFPVFRISMSSLTSTLSSLPTSQYLILSLCAGKGLSPPC